MDAALNPSTALARVIVDEFARCGLTDAVIAPGSRSTPLALAFLDDPRVRVHVRVDERSAGFLALGLGRGSGRPVAVVCTSGTAAANFHPAVMEADQAGVALLVLTADRPPELRGTGANQTVDQIGLYGSTVRMFAEVGVAEPIPGMNAYWRSLTCRAWAAATTEPAGPVHLNVAFRDPLVPSGGEEWPEPLDGRDDHAPWIRGGQAPVPPEPMVLPPFERGVIVCGDGNYDPTPFLALAAATGWPLLAEPTSNARRGAQLALSTYRHLLGCADFAAEHRPDLVVSVGRPGLSRQLISYLRSARRHVVVGPADGFADPARTATDRVSAVAPPPDWDPDTSWARSWRAAEAAARTALDKVLDEDDRLSEPRLARDLAAALPNGSALFAGSSMPIRDLDATMNPRCGVRVLGNRGASGIDGTVSTAVGAALAHQSVGGGPSFALLGDLALIHDQNGLVVGPEEPVPDLAIVVVNNDGGGIFSGLEQAGHPGFERLFATPHGVDPQRIAAAAGVQHTLVALADDLAKPLDGVGLRLVEVRTVREESASLRRRMQQTVCSALT